MDIYFCGLGYIVHKLVNGYQLFWRTIFPCILWYILLNSNRHQTWRWKQYAFQISWYSPAGWYYVITRRPLCECSRPEVLQNVWSYVLRGSRVTHRVPLPELRAVWFRFAFPDISCVPYFCECVILSLHHSSQCVLNCVFSGSPIFTLARCSETRKWNKTKQISKYKMQHNWRLEKDFFLQVVLFMYFTYPVFVNVNYFFPHRISVYFILFGLSISPFFDVTSLSPLVKEECKGKTITRKYMLN